MQTVARILAPFQFSLLRESGNRAIVEAVRIIAEAIVSTPYGQALRFPAPLLITVGTSEFCPHACPNCYSSSGPLGAGRRTDAPVAMFEQIARSRTPCVMISGGEPLAVSNIADLLAPLLEAGKFVYVATNASVGRLTDIITSHRDSLFFLLSIWGNSALHDKLRGPGSFIRLERNLERLNQLGSEGRLLVVLSNRGLSIFDTVEELAKKYRVASVLVTRKLRVGRTAGDALEFEPDVMQSVSDRMQAIKRYVRQVYLDVPELRSQDGTKPSLLRGVFGIPASDACSAGNWMMHLDSEGVAYPCYTLEGNAEASASYSFSLPEQWAHLSEGIARRAQPGCAGETMTFHGAKNA